MTGWERVQWITLALIPRLGRRTLERLLAHFGSLDAVLSADDAALKAVPRIGAKTAAAIRAADPHATAAALDDWQAAEISALLPGDDAFPARLAALDDSPAVLFWRGSALPDESTPTVAIVGTRRPTRAAREMAIALAETLASDGWAVVSGLALGIDTAAHSGALSGGGMTVAVLGSGLTTIYPPSNATLAEHIAARGALLSEVHPDATPDRSALVARNRLISGLSDVVIVIEAGLDSGSLYAARFAQTYGRALFAADSPAAGNLRLLAEGASRLPADSARWQELLVPYRPR
jgi:DNA processing protein